MKITKLGHCCLVIEEHPSTSLRTGGLKILTDPGAYTTAQNEVTGVDVILITHEHPDHLHMESLKTVVANNPQAKIFTNSGVGKLLDAENLKYELLEHQQQTSIKNITIEGHGQDHAFIYDTVPM